MSDKNGLRHLFYQLNLNGRKARWLNMTSEFDFEIRNIKDKENKVVEAINKQIQVNHLESMSSYGKDL